MEFDPEDQDIIQLLAKLREIEAKYPEELLAARRQSYLHRMGEVGLGLGAERGMEEIAKDVKTPNVSPAASTLVETVLVVAIIAEALTVTYFYRDKLAGLVRTMTAKAGVEEATPAPAVTTALEIQTATPAPALTATMPSAATWTMPVEIPATGTIAPLPSVVEDDNTTGVDLLNATPAPNDLDGNHTNNGNHYGQTPKPERTKEKGNNPPPKDHDKQPPKDNNDKPPKDKNDQHPGDDKAQQPQRP